MTSYDEWDDERVSAEERRHREIMNELKSARAEQEAFRNSLTVAIFIAAMVLGLSYFFS
jgi:hypothetical protein